MGIEQQRAVKDAAYEEAKRYMDNARDTYRLARKDGKSYTDKKYVRGGGNYAYHAVLIALEGLLKAKGIEPPQKKNIDYYRQQIGAMDRKLLRTLNLAYDILHLAAGYEGNQSVAMNQEGLEYAEEIIERLKD